MELAPERSGDRLRRPSGSRLLDLLLLRSRFRRLLSVDGVFLRRFFLGWPCRCLDRFRPVSLLVDMPRGDSPLKVDDLTSDVDAPSRGFSSGC